MKKYIILLAVPFMFACGTEDQLLKEGVYKATYSYKIDYCSMCPSIAGETYERDWYFKDSVLTAWNQKYLMEDHGNKLVHDIEDDSHVFHLEIYPGSEGEGFGGFFYVDYPGLMLTIGDVEAELKR